MFWRYGTIDTVFVNPCSLSHDSWRAVLDQAFCHNGLAVDLLAGFGNVHRYQCFGTLSKLRSSLVDAMASKEESGPTYFLPFQMRIFIALIQCKLLVLNIKVLLVAHLQHAAPSKLHPTSTRRVVQVTGD